MPKRVLAALSGLSLLAFLPARASAMCPVCTLTVGAGLGMAKYLGVDDLVSGIWIGGFIVSSTGWLISVLNRRNIRFPGRILLITVASYALFLVPFYQVGFIGQYFNTIWGMDRLLLGIVAGSIAFFLAALWYKSLKRRHGGHASFPFQHIAMEVGSLVVMSILFFVLGKLVPTII
ncbi:MAG: hypothetical protein AAB728_00185 [Patescibacteria group bacterium]